MPQVTPAVPVASSLFKNYVAPQAGAQVKTGPGVFRGLTINTAGSSSVITAYDGTSASGSKIGAFSTAAQDSITNLNIAFVTGLFLVATGTLADFTVLYN